VLKSDPGYFYVQKRKSLDSGDDPFWAISQRNNNLFKMCQIFEVSADYIIFGDTDDACMAELRQILSKQNPKVKAKIVAGLKAALE
jgi:hypothetical protein